MKKKKNKFYFFSSALPIVVLILNGYGKSTLIELTTTWLSSTRLNTLVDLYLFLKSNLNNDKKASYSKYYNTYLSIKYSIIIEFSSLLLRKYVENDNKRIVSSIKKIYNFYFFVKTMNGSENLNPYYTLF